MRYLRSPFETEERAAFRDMIKGFVAKEIQPHAFKWDEAGAIPGELHEKLGALGVFGLGIDEEYGGLGFDDSFMRVIYAEEMAHAGPAAFLRH